MNGQLYFFTVLLGLVWTILCVILFFKVWGMTNDIKAIRELLQGRHEDKGEPVAISDTEQQQERKGEGAPMSNTGNDSSTTMIWVAAAALAMAVVYLLFFLGK